MKCVNATCVAYGSVAIEDAPQRAPLGAMLWCMELFLSESALAEIEQAQRDALRRQAEAMVDRMQDAIDEYSSQIAAVATRDGAREIAAAIFLVRANNLLREVRDAVTSPTLQTLGLRSAFELAVVGRFLLVDKDGADEFARRYNMSLKGDSQLGTFFEHPSGRPADFLAHLVNADSKAPRDVASLSAKLDKHDGFSAADRLSAQACWHLLHKHVSNSGSHASLSSIKRYTRRDGDVLLIDRRSDPIFTEPPVLVVAAFIRDLAVDVLAAQGLPSDNLPHEIRRPHDEVLNRDSEPDRSAP